MAAVVTTNFVQTAYPQHGSMLVVVATNFVQTAYPQHGSMLVCWCMGMEDNSRALKATRPRKGRHKLTRSLLINSHSRQLPCTSTRNQQTLNS